MDNYEQVLLKEDFKNPPFKTNKKKIIPFKHAMIKKSEKTEDQMIKLIINFFGDTIRIDIDDKHELKTER